MKDHIGKIFAVVAVVAIVGSIAYANHVANEANEGIVLTDHIKGNEAAAVKLTEYSDFQCPACAQFYPVIQDIMADYGDQIAFEYKHFPLISIHPFAVPAARAAEAAGQQGKFWEMHDKLFEEQQTWSNSGNPISFFNTYAEEIGLDVELFKRHYKASLIEESVNDDFRQARDLGLTGTPSFFLNDERMDFTSFPEFREQIEAAIGVDTATATGTPTVEVGGVEAAGEADVRFGL